MRDWDPQFLAYARMQSEPEDAPAKCRNVDEVVEVCSLVQIACNEIERLQRYEAVVKQLAGLISVWDLQDYERETDTRLF